jgi:hypothetical protein
MLFVVVVDVVCLLVAPGAVAAYDLIVWLLFCLVVWLFGCCC